MLGSVFNRNRLSQPKYEPINSNHADLDTGTHRKRSRPALKTSFYIGLMLCSLVQITLLFCVIFALDISASRALNTSQQELGFRVSNCSCGATTAEARSLDCTFDVLSLSWLPPPCRDEALTREFATSGPGPGGAWDYWADGNGTQPLTTDEVGELAGREDGFVYTTLGFHVLHCALYWRKQWRSARGVGASAVEARYSPESHVEHCQRVFMLGGPRDGGMTESVVRLGGEFF